MRTATCFRLDNVWTSRIVSVARNLCGPGTTASQHRLRITPLAPGSSQEPLRLDRAGGAREGRRSGRLGGGELTITARIGAHYLI